VRLLTLGQREAVTRPETYPERGYDAADDAHDRPDAEPLLRCCDLGATLPHVPVFFDVRDGQLDGGLVRDEPMEEEPKLQLRGAVAVIAGREDALVQKRRGLEGQPVT